jgi:ketosteroid isomerase-like protein
MQAILIGAALAALLAVPALAAEPLLHGPKSTAEAVLAAERAFEAMSEKDGAAKAFRTYMDAEDGLELAGKGDPVRGADAIFKAQGGLAPPTTVLKWEPVEVFASTGDMGLTWGRWSFSKIGGDKPLATGRYVTVWRRNAQGEWKGLLDIGNPD